jgi:phosphinothricin acetyltransferase
MTLVVRDATTNDIPAFHAIYAHHVRTGFGTVDEVPPPLQDYDAKVRGILATGLPWLAAMSGSEVIGFAYASPFRPRSGYRYTAEDSVYIRDDKRGAGVGSALLSQLIERLKALEVRQVVAVIGDSQNAGSIALHRKAGFEHSGMIKAIGYKLGRWVDVVMMQRSLNGGDASAPPATLPWRLS